MSTFTLKSNNGDFDIGSGGGSDNCVDVLGLIKGFKAYKAGINIVDHIEIFYQEDPGCNFFDLTTGALTFSDSGVTQNV